MKKYVPTPIDGTKSFYGKCYVTVDDDGTETVYSYDTKVMSKTPDGVLHRYWKGCSVTTLRHVGAVFGKISKKEWNAMPVEA